jgi:hypothetical protein
MVKRLLHRQVSLLNHLTSGSAIFGDERKLPLDPALRGIDRALLHIEARFSHDKRMQKIVAAFPRTFELLGAERESLIKDFAATCPPDDISRVANARQFHEYLRARWGRQPPMAPYLRDVAACELACAGARAAAEGSGVDESVQPATRRQIRCRPDIVLLRCAYDIRPIFEDNATAAIPMKRATRLAITLSSGGDQPRIFELAPEAFDLLGALAQWTDAAAFDIAPAADQLIAELAQAGLVEVRG